MNSDANTSQNDKISSELNNVSFTDTPLKSHETTAKTIPIYEEKYTITKETTATKVHIKKRWKNITQKIEIPVKYEEMYINRKELDSLGQNELVEVFSKVKEKFSEVFHSSQHETVNKIDNSKDIDSPHYPDDIDIKIQKGDNADVKNTTKPVNAPKIEDEDGQEMTTLAQTIDSNNEDSNQNQTQSNQSMSFSSEEQVIPIWGEQIIVNKKLVKLGEIVIKKVKKVEKRLVDVEVRKEKVTIIYPDGNKNEIT